MAKSLNLERRLLDVKNQATASGLNAQVRALDFKGGDWLALKFVHNSKVVELRYRKGPTQARILVAGSDADLARRVRDLHLSLMRQHDKVLENGYRRMLSRAARMLEEFESRMLKDQEVLNRGLEFIRTEELGAAYQPALAIRSQGRRERNYDVIPAVVIPVDPVPEMAAIGSDGKLFDLSDLLRSQREERKDVKPSGSRNWNLVEGIADVGQVGVELISDVVASFAFSSIPGNAAKAAEQISEAATSGAAEITAETAPQAFEAIADAGGSAAEVVVQSSSCLGDAACAGADCGGIDCMPF